MVLSFFYNFFLVCKIRWVNRNVFKIWLSICPLLNQAKKILGNVMQVANPLKNCHFWYEFDGTDSDSYL